MLCRGLRTSYSGVAFRGSPGISGTILGAVATFIVSTIAALGYLGIVVLMAIESACIPLPSEIIMPFSGYLITTGRFNLFAVATAGAVGCTLGSTIAYSLGALGGRRTVERWGRFVLMTPGDLERVDRFFTRYGAVTVFVGRLLPVVRTFISLPAGIAQMPFITFQVYTFAGSWFWCLALAYAGQKLGEAWNASPALKAALHTVDLLVVISLLGLIGWYIVVVVRRIRRG